MKKTFAWIGIGYLVVVAGAQFMTNSSQDSPTADQISALPSPSTFLSISGTSTGALVDLGTAAALWWFLIKR